MDVYVGLLLISVAALIGGIICLEIPARRLSLSPGWLSERTIRTRFARRPSPCMREPEAVLQEFRFGDTTSHSARA